MSQTDEPIIQKIRQITKPVLKDLTREIADVHGKGPIFGFQPLDYSSEEELDYDYGQIKINPEIFKLIRGNKFKKSKELLRSYEIDQIRQERVLYSFTLGRKLFSKENTDK